MSKTIENPKRRRLLITSLAAMASVPLGTSLLGSQAFAADMPELSEDDPTAKALKYHSDATKAPRTDKAGTAADKQFCHNCQFVKADSGALRPCQIFPGKLVSANGWCASWMAKM
jgi:hypothetical protein